MNKTFDQQFDSFLEEQRKGATGQRLAHLCKDLSGTKEMFSEILYPVFQTFEGFKLEKEIIDTQGVRIYIDAFYEPLVTGFESEGYVTHAQNIKRERFDFEKRRNRTYAHYRYFYYPFTRDDAEKNAEACRRELYAYLGKYANQKDRSKLTPDQKLLILYLLQLNRPFRAEDVCVYLQCHRHTGRLMIRRLMENTIVIPRNPALKNHHKFVIDPETASRYL